MCATFSPASRTKILGICTRETQFDSQPSAHSKPFPAYFAGGGRYILNYSKYGIPNFILTLLGGSEDLSSFRVLAITPQISESMGHSTRAYITKSLRTGPLT